MNRADLPALLGGQPLFPDGPPEWPSPMEDVRLAMEEAYRNGSWGKYHAQNVQRLEGEISSLFGSPHVLPCASGTLAIETALRVLRVGQGDEVILAGYDYPGNFLSVHAVGAMPTLVDLLPDNWNLNPSLLGPAIGPNTRAVIVSHLHGGMVRMSEVMEICRARGIPVIEDAAQAAGAMVEGRFAGTWGDMGILSFGGSKLLTAGRGGALLTANPDFHQRARLELFRGTNWVAPLSELQAAVLIPQLRALSMRNQQRLRAVAFLRRELEAIPGLRLFSQGTNGSPAFYKLGIQLDERPFGVTRQTLVPAMRAEGLAVDEGFRSLHVNRSSKRFHAPAPLPEAERAHRNCLVMHHPILLAEETLLAQIVRAFTRIYEAREAF